MTEQTIETLAQYAQNAAWLMVFVAMVLAYRCKTMHAPVYAGLASIGLSMGNVILELLAYTPPSGELAQFSDRYMTLNGILLMGLVVLPIFTALLTFFGRLAHWGMMNNRGRRSRVAA